VILGGDSTVIGPYQAVNYTLIFQISGVFFQTTLLDPTTGIYDYGLAANGGYADATSFFGAFFDQPNCTGTEYATWSPLFLVNSLARIGNIGVYAGNANSLTITAQSYLVGARNGSGPICYTPGDPNYPWTVQSETAAPFPYPTVDLTAIVSDLPYSVACR
jgi:hypothetical protein